MVYMTPILTLLKHLASSTICFSNQEKIKKEPPASPPLQNLPTSSSPQQQEPYKPQPKPEPQTRSLPNLLLAFHYLLHHLLIHHHHFKFFGFSLSYLTEFSISDSLKIMCFLFFPTTLSLTVL